MSQSDPTDQILSVTSQLCSVDREVLLRMSSEILCQNLPWQRTYSEYQSGEWSTVSLMNPSGAAKDNKIYDGHAIETALLRFLPQTKAFLFDLGLKYMWVRLAKLEANGYLWEHVDYKELNDQHRLRLHVPLKTNEDAFISLPEYNIHLGRGFIWKLNPKTRHGAANLGSKDRLHLIMDCYLDPPLMKMVDQQFLDKKFIRTKEKLNFNIKKFLNLKDLGHEDAAVDFLLKSFHRYRFGEETSYDLITNYFSENQFEKEKWELRRQIYVNGGLRE